MGEESPVIRGPESDGHLVLITIQEKYGKGVILSTDDYFRDENCIMHFNRRKLSEAHQWNRNRAFCQLKDQTNPVIIDNTNIRRWEMKPYVEMGLRFRYHIRFRDAWDTWKCSTEELYRRNNYVVPLPVMENMKRRFEKVRNIYDVLNS
ncbi:NEDD4-binding protein 2-like 1 isoform X1 [Paramormyrops kingsleyae]|uniref:NEDD4-binding protein 2-like 1 isoform X1 n=1 Tax=Paramormyrops kingsleyae TaxID=1676925 RepID=UPI003B96BBC8